MHDIGKNIVGVVLQCNNFEVIDLGVMVPCAKILETAQAEGVDLIGLSGLITPSLEEMSFVASEMEREGFTTPLLIGGATTSRAHTAVKIAPKYSGPVVHVLDASRAVGVAGSLRERRPQGELRGRRWRPTTRRYGWHAPAADSRDDRAPIADARANRVVIDWKAITPPRPCFTGVRTLAKYPLAELVERIDWTPVFPDVGARGTLPCDPHRPQGGTDGIEPVARCAGACSTGSCGKTARGARRVRLLARQQRGRRHRGLYRRHATRARAR